MCPFPRQKGTMREEVSADQQSGEEFYAQTCPFLIIYLSICCEVMVSKKEILLCDQKGRLDKSSLAHTRAVLLSLDALF